LTDLLDGLIAKTLKRRSRIGYFLDPIADKLFLNTLCLFLAFSEESPFPLHVPKWVAIGILIKDVSWATGGLVTRFLTGRMTIPPSIWGKLTTLSIAALICVVLSTPDLLSADAAAGIVRRGGAICLALAGVALCGYAYKVLKERL